MEINSGGDRKKIIIAVVAVAVIIIAVAFGVAFGKYAGVQSIVDYPDQEEGINKDESGIQSEQQKDVLMRNDVPRLTKEICELLKYDGELKNIDIVLHYSKNTDEMDDAALTGIELTCQGNGINIIADCQLQKNQWTIITIDNRDDRKKVYYSQKEILSGEALYDFNTGTVIMTYAEQESKAEAERKKKEEESRRKEEESKEQAKQEAAKRREQFIAECKTYSYKEIARRPQDYKGKKAKFTGKVMQVSKEYSGYTLLVQVTKSKYGYEDIVYVEYKPKDADESNVLEDDIVTIYGELGGERTYQSTVGKSITVPLFQCEYITILSE